LATIAGLVIVASGCAGGRSSATQPAPSSLLAFNATLVGGGEFDGRTLAGRPAVFWFWAPT
jgi:hypothetical protein